MSEAEIARMQAAGFSQAETERARTMNRKRRKSMLKRGPAAYHGLDRIAGKAAGMSKNPLWQQQFPPVADEQRG